MAESGGKIALAVALITTLGVLGAAFIEAWGKRAPAPAPAAAQSTVPEVAGTWSDQFGARFTIVRDAGRLSLDGRLEQRIMAGTGAVEGPSVTFAITNNLEPGTIDCAGTVASASTIVSTCHDPDGTPFDWILTRAGD